MANASLSDSPTFTRPPLAPHFLTYTFIGPGFYGYYADDGQSNPVLEEMTQGALPSSPHFENINDLSAGERIAPEVGRARGAIARDLRVLIASHRAEGEIA
jgi:hypothetical protein